MWIPPINNIAVLAFFGDGSPSTTNCCSRLWGVICDIETRQYKGEKTPKNRPLNLKKKTTSANKRGVPLGYIFFYGAYIFHSPKGCGLCLKTWVENDGINRKFRCGHVPIDFLKSLLGCLTSVKLINLFTSVWNNGTQLPWT